MGSHRDSERPDPYAVLGVSRQASAAELARAYRRAARATHPDNGDSGSAERFLGVTAAYDELRDPPRRAVYDRTHLATRRQTPMVRGEVAHYAAPSSQHIVLGRPVARRPAWEHGIIDELVRVAASFLRADR